MGMAEIPDVAPSNVDSARAWDGDQGAYWAEQETRFNEGVAGYQHRFLAAAEIKPTERVLDIGCGTGQTTREAARLAHNGTVLGVDLSSRMIEVACRRAIDDGIDNVEFIRADAQIHPFPPRQFDVAISRIGVMFFGDPVAAFSNITRALRPGGRLTFLVWRAAELNEWITEIARVVAAGRSVPEPPADAPGPLSLADPDRAGALLAAAGCTDITFDDVREPMRFGPDADAAYRFVRGMGFVGTMLGELDESARARVLDDLRGSIDAHSTPDGVRYRSAAWIIRARVDA